MSLYQGVGRRDGQGVTDGPGHPGPAKLTHSPVARRVSSSSSGGSSSQEACAGVGMVRTELLRPRLALCVLGVGGKRGTRGRGTGRAKGSSCGGRLFSSHLFLVTCLRATFLYSPLLTSGLNLSPVLFITVSPHPLPHLPTPQHSMNAL